MKHPVKVSVIIPVYNVADYLPFAMQSCIDQTLRDVEFICVNDGSTDNSLEILKKYAELDGRITVIDKPNGGVSSARNRGIDESCGEWIMFLDPDDYLEPNACERVWIEGEEGRTDIINFGTRIIPNQPKASDWHYYALATGTRRYYAFEPHILFGEPSSKPFIWHQAYSKKLLDRTGIRFDEGLKLGEDVAFLMCLYPSASHFALVEDKLYNYRFVRNDSAMQMLRRDPSVKISLHMSVTDKVLKYWSDNGLAQKYTNELLIWVIDFITHDLGDDTLPSDVKSNFAYTLFEQIRNYGVLSAGTKLTSRTKSYLKELKAFINS